MSRPLSAQVDPLLLPFLQAAGDEEADQVLAGLLSRHVEPVIQNIVGYKFRVFFNDNHRAQDNDADDIFSEALVSLLGHLQELRENPQLPPVRNLRSYVAVTSYRACYEHLRRKYPQRFSLKNKIRYFLRHKEGFALWETEESDWLAGLAEYQGQDRAASTRLRQLQDHFAEIVPEFLPNSNVAGASLNDLLAAIFKWSGGAIELDQLVGIVAEAWQIKDQPVNERRQQDELNEERVQGGPSIEDQFSDHAVLAKLWREIVDLSARHCAALLLNLRDERGGNALELFVFTGVATFQQIAAALGETEEWLATVWNDLPLEDTKIAERLGLIRQQVINLRKTARGRLAKCLKKTESG